MPTQSFADYYSPDQFAAFEAHYAISVPSDAPGYDGYVEALGVHMKSMQDSMAQYLGPKFSAGDMGAVSFNTGRNHALASRWNRLVAGGIDRADSYEDLASLSRILGRALLQGFGRSKDGYQKIIAVANTGDFEWFEINAETDCATTGSSLYLELKNWRPSLGEVNHKNRDNPFTPVTAELPGPEVVHHVIQAPSGEILISDWFRLEEFTEAVKNKGDYISVNHNAGCEALARHYAENHGFMSVMVGDFIPAVIERDGQIVIARVSDDPEGLQGRQVGSVCTDVWWATAIDREVLVNIIAAGSSPEMAERLVSEYLAPNGCSDSITRVRVPPGVLHVYHTAKYQDMRDFESPGVSTGGLDQVFAVISEKELTWSPKAGSAEVPDQNDDAAMAAARRPRPR